ncbi:hypothetical protein [Campylobacter molothri]|uniref:hypothetical protein n=1 Tax=Campylobacter molothri TaxID=1032242 RepID=UPI00301D07A3|nr:hypothetical protein [Campylobacter sp. RM10534]
MADNLEQIANDLNTASLNLQELRGKYEGALDVLNAKNAQIIEALDSKKEEALQEVKGVKDTAITEITNLQDTALSNIDESKNASITELTNKKTEALTKIEEAKTEQGEKIAKLETELNLKAKLLTQNLEWIVGNGGNFDDIDKALDEISKYCSVNGKFYAILKIKNGYIINKPIIINIPNVFIEIKGENGISDELIIDLNNKNWGFWGIKTLSRVSIHDLTITSKSINNSAIYISSFVDLYNLNINANGYSAIALTEGLLVLDTVNIVNNFSENELFFDLSVGNGKCQFGKNVKFKSNNKINGVAIRAATNGQIGSVWWQTGNEISGTYKNGIQVDGGGVVDNPNITMNGTYTNKYSQTPRQWTSSGYISTDL